MKITDLNKRFELCWLSVKGPRLEPELRFHHSRLWRFDYAHAQSRTAIELEGGIWTGGRHVNPSGFTEDCIKYNAAAALGWRVFRLPSALINVPTCQEIAELIKGRMTYEK